MEIMSTEPWKYDSNARTDEHTHARATGFVRQRAKYTRCGEAGFPIVHVIDISYLVILLYYKNKHNLKFLESLSLISSRK